MVEYIIAHIQLHPANSIGVYYPVQNEPDLQGLYKTLSAQGVQLSLPVIVDKNAPLQFLQWIPGDTLIEGAHGIAIPEEQKICSPQAVLIPCVGFTSSRYRLGYGGGFFDRTLSHSPSLYSIGIAYSCQMTDFDVGQYDVPLDCIVTENGVI